MLPAEEPLPQIGILFLCANLAISATKRKYSQKSVSVIISSSLFSLLQTFAGGLFPYLHFSPLQHSFLRYLSGVSFPGALKHEKFILPRESSRLHLSAISLVLEIAWGIS